MNMEYRTRRIHMAPFLYSYVIVSAMHSEGLLGRLLDVMMSAAWCACEDMRRPLERQLRVASEMPIDMGFPSSMRVHVRSGQWRASQRPYRISTCTQGT